MNATEFVLIKHALEKHGCTIELAALHAIGINLSKLASSQQQTMMDTECIERITKHGLELEQKLAAAERELSLVRKAAAHVSARNDQAVAGAHEHIAELIKELEVSQQRCKELETVVDETIDGKYMAHYGGCSRRLNILRKCNCGLAEHIQKLSDIRAARQTGEQG